VPVKAERTGLYGRKASAQAAAMPPTRFGHMRTSSVHAGAAAQLRNSPTMRSGTAALPCPGMSPCPTKRAVIRKII